MPRSLYCFQVEAVVGNDGKMLHAGSRDSVIEGCLMPKISTIEFQRKRFAVEGIFEHEFD